MKDGTKIQKGLRAVTIWLAANNLEAHMCQIHFACKWSRKAGLVLPQYSCKYGRQDYESEDYTHRSSSFYEDGKRERRSLLQYDPAASRPGREGDG